MSFQGVQKAHSSAKCHAIIEYAIMRPDRIAFGWLRAVRAQHRYSASRIISIASIGFSKDWSITHCHSQFSTFDLGIHRRKYIRVRHFSGCPHDLVKTQQDPKVGHIGVEISPAETGEERHALLGSQSGLSTTEDSSVNVPTDASLDDEFEEHIVIEADGRIWDESSAGANSAARVSSDKRLDLDPAGTEALNSSNFENDLVLRPYQNECIRLCAEKMSAEPVRIAVSMATGTGKTVTFAHLLREIKPLSEKAVQTLIVAPSKEIVEQTARQCAKLYGDENVEIELGNEKASGNALITVASVQSLNSGSRLLKFSPENFKALIIDEAHHIVAPTYLKLLKHFNADSKSPMVNVIGFSATLDRHDGQLVSTALDELLYQLELPEMIEQKWLCPVKFTRVFPTNMEVKYKDKEEMYVRIAEKATTKKAVHRVVDAWLQQAANRRSTLVFCVDKEHVQMTTKAFCAKSIEARSVTGETPSKERSRLIAEFANGDFPVLINCGVFLEGADIPNVDCIMLARPVKSQPMLLQMIGRGLRQCPDKQDCHVIDLAGCLSHGISTSRRYILSSASESFNENMTAQEKARNELNELKKTVEKKISESEKRPSIRPRSEDLTFLNYDGISSLNVDTPLSRRIESFSTFSWVHIKKQQFLLSLGLSEGTLLVFEDPVNGMIVWNNGNEY